MGTAAVHDLIIQYQHAFRILYEEMGRFDATTWIKGFSYFQTPVKQAMHIFDCLDFYTTEHATEPYAWGHRFGGGWWELPDERLPDQAAVIAYARELETRVVKQLSALQDEDLLKSAGIPDEDVTVIGHHVYALKHTMHHHGQMAALSVYHGYEGGSWD